MSESCNNSSFLKMTEKIIEQASDLGPLSLISKEELIETKKAIKVYKKDCNICNNETMVPIVPNSVLQTQCKNFGEQVNKIQEWNKEAFEIIDDESDYEDYEYEENNLLSDDMFRADYYGEEMKDALQQEI